MMCCGWIGWLWLNRHQWVHWVVWSSWRSRVGMRHIWNCTWKLIAWMSVSEVSRVEYWWHTWTGLLWCCKWLHLLLHTHLQALLPCLLKTCLESLLPCLLPGSVVTSWVLSSQTFSKYFPQFGLLLLQADFSSFCCLLRNWGNMGQRWHCIVRNWFVHTEFHAPIVWPFCLVDFIWPVTWFLAPFHSHTLSLKICCEVMPLLLNLLHWIPCTKLLSQTFQIYTFQICFCILSHNDSTALGVPCRIQLVAVYPLL